MSLPRIQGLNPLQVVPQLVTFLKSRPQNGLSPQGSWYAIRNVSDSEAEVHIYDEIGFFGITATDFIRDLSSIKASAITLRINSGGGDVDDGVAIFNAVRRHRATVTSYIDGLAASAASFIAMAGDRVIMSPHSKMMIHDAAGFCMGNAEDMRQLADTLDLYSNDIARIYSERAGGSTEEWRERMKAETWMSDREAVELGLADAIDGEEPKKAKAQTNTVVAQTPVDFLALINQQQEDAAELVA